MVIAEERIVNKVVKI